MDNKCYLVIFDNFPGLRGAEDPGYFSTDVDAVFMNADNAVEYVKEHADYVKDDMEQHPDKITIVYDGELERWPWMFTWEEGGRQLTYKVVPRNFEDWA